MMAQEVMCDCELRKKWEEEIFFSKYFYNLCTNNIQFT